MKILRRSLEIASYIGLTAEQSIQPSLFNRKSVAALVALSLASISCLIYLLHEASTFVEYTHAVAVFSSILLAMVTHAILIWKMEPIFNFLSLMENKAVQPSLFGS